MTLKQVIYAVTVLKVQLSARGVDENVDYEMLSITSKEIRIKRDGKTLKIPLVTL